MGYLSESLAPGETVLMRGRWPTIFWVGAWAALILLGVIIVGVFIFLRSVIVMSTTEFAVTDQRVVLKRGWLNRHTQELAVASVEGAHLDQSFWDRLWGYGRVLVTGTGDARIVFPPMADPVAFRRAIETARASSKEVRLAEADREMLSRVDGREEPPRKKRRFLGLVGS